MRPSAVALLVICTLVACEPREGTPEPTVTATVTEAPAPSPAPEPLALDPVVLTASLAERPAAWDLMAEIPFGPRRSQLGYAPAKPDAYVGGVPPSFAVDPDGSLWILDYVKGRVAHYSASGRYLGSVGRFPVGGTWRVRDLQVRQGDLIVLRGHIATAASALTAVHGADQGPITEVTLDGEAVILYSIVPGAAALTGELHGYAMSDEHVVGSGPLGWVEADQSTGSVSQRQGVPLPGRNSMDIAWPLDVRFQPIGDRLEVTFVSDEVQSVLPLRFRFVRRLGSDPLRHGVAVWVQAAQPNGLAAYVRIITSGRDEDLPLGGWWYLQVSDDGSPLVWERLPEPGIPTDAQVRYLSAAPDGSVYLMLLGRWGARIYRR